MCRILRHISCAGDKHALSGKTLSARCQHLLCKITCAITRCFRAQTTSTPILAFTRQCACKLIAKAFVLAKHKAYFARPYAYIARRNIRVSANMTEQLRHETLAETHHLCIGLATRREITSTFRAAHRQSGQTILECLLKSKELHNTQVHTCMEADTAFVRANSAIHLHAITTIYLHFSTIIHPRHAEHDYALRLYHSFQHFRIQQIRISHHIRSHTFHYFADSLMKLQFARVFANQLCHKGIDIFFCIHNTDSLI